MHGWEGLAALGIAISSREHANSSGPMKFHTITIGRSDRLAAATDTRQKGIRTYLKQLERGCQITTEPSMESTVVARHQDADKFSFFPPIDIHHSGQSPEAAEPCLCLKQDCVTPLLLSAIE